MLFWIFTGLIVLGLIITVAMSEGDGEIIFISFFGWGIAWAMICVILIGMIPAQIWGHQADSHYSERHHVVSLSDTEGVEGEIHGSLFFTTGFVGSYQFYSWYEKQPDGSYESRQVSTRFTPVKVWEIGPEREPGAVENYYCENNVEPSWLSPIDFTNPNRCYTESWDLYVPKGTITREFKLDGP